MKNKARPQHLVLQMSLAILEWDNIPNKACQTSHHKEASR